MAERILYDLEAADPDVRFSPFCWLAKFGMAHKGLEFDTVGLGFLPKSDYPDPDYGKLPMLKDGDHLIKDSANILAHLEQTYPDRPFSKDDAAKAKMARLQEWVGSSLFPAIGPMLFYRVANALNPEEKDYFKTTREERFGMPLEKLAQNPELPAKMDAALKALELELGQGPFLGGDAPDLADYIAASPFMWQYSISSETLYKAPPAVEQWFARISTHYDQFKLHCANC